MLSTLDASPRTPRSPLLRAALLAATAAAVGSTAGAQREWGGTPPSLDPGASGIARLERLVPAVVLPPVDEAVLLAEDAAQPPDVPHRFAAAHAVDLSARTDGLWTTLADGSRVWRLELVSPGARSLSLLFERFQLPEGAEFYVYDASRSVVRGAYTTWNHRRDGRFAVRPTPGDRLTLEYWQPADSVGVPELTLAEVYHAYRSANPAGDSGAGVQQMSGSCQVDVLCPEGAPFADQVEGIVHIQRGAFACSGALVNNTAEDGRLLVLTAEHCQGSSNLDTAIFTFNYHEATCGGSGAMRTDSVLGSVTLAVDDPLDVLLVELEEQPAEGYGIKYLGWDRSDVPPAGGTVGLHHPQGDAMKIAVDDDPPSFNGTFWNIAQWDVGTTEPGSSGSPLLDPNGRVIGQLSFGTADCANPMDDNYGRLAAEWALVGPFLDPLASGVTTLDLYDPNAGSGDPLDVTSVAPSDLPVLMPGTGEDVTLLGAGFQEGMSVSVDGVPVTALTRRTSERLTFDLPELPALGSVDVVVQKGAESAALAVDVIAPEPPAFQAGTGDAGNTVGSIDGVDLVLAGVPGDLHLIVYSLSNLPSSHPLWQIDIGDNFTDLVGLGCHVIGGGGTTTVNIPITGLSFTTVYGQTTNISGGVPFAVSNLQEIFILF